jgi:protein-S-isoprenylcysteine O-methyltransferase Ste14
MGPALATLDRPDLRVAPNPRRPVARSRAERVAAVVDLERPDQLVDSGPYAFSRNPMYLAWTLGYVGVALVAGTAWPLLLLPAVLGVTHVVVKSEERSLERQFGAAYQSY